MTDELADFNRILKSASADFIVDSLLDRPNAAPAETHEHFFDRMMHTRAVRWCEETQDCPYVEIQDMFGQWHEYLAGKPLADLRDKVSRMQASLDETAELHEPNLQQIMALTVENTTLKQQVQEKSREQQELLCQVERLRKENRLLHRRINKAVVSLRNARLR